MDPVKIKLYAPPGGDYSEEIESIVKKIQEKYVNVSFSIFPVSWPTPGDPMVPVFSVEVEVENAVDDKGKYSSYLVNVGRIINWRETDSRVCSFLEDILQDGEPYGLIPK